MIRCRTPMDFVTLVNTTLQPLGIGWKDVLTIIHVFGAVFGAGGAILSDGMTLLSFSDRIFSRQELRLLKFGAHMTLFGLIILVISGYGIYQTDVERYMQSTKFLAKMTIVAVLTVNGLLMHFVCLPLIERGADKPVFENYYFVKYTPFFFIGGAVSLVSWSFTLTLGTLDRILLPYVTIVCLYAVAVILGVCGALFETARLYMVEKLRGGTVRVPNRPPLE